MISANLIDGVRMARGVAAAILSFGVIALCWPNTRLYFTIRVHFLSIV